MKLPIKIDLPQSFFQQEIRCDHLVTPEVKAHWAVLLDLLVEFDRVCKKNGVRYFLDGGTLLGAVRHKGFVPWDDDVDVIMLRSDYEKLCGIAGTEFVEPYFWQTNYTDPGSARRHAQLRNSQTTAILEDEMDGGIPVAAFNQGVFLDVFIFDEVPDDEEELKGFRKELQYHIDILWELKTLFNKYRNPWIASALDQQMRIFDEAVTRYKNTGQSRVANMSLNPNFKLSYFFPKTYFTETVDLPFEQYYFPCSKEASAMLTGYYGNWTQFVKGTNMHGGLFLDVHNPYTKYIKQTTNSSREKHPLIVVFEQRNRAWNDFDLKKQQLQELERQLQEKRGQLQEAQDIINEKTIKIRKQELELNRIKNTRIWKIASCLNLIEPSNE